MAGKVSVKTVLIVVIAMLVIVLSVLGISVGRNYLASAAGGSEPAAMVTVPTEKSVKISWTTDKATLSRVQYGTTPASMLLQSDLSEEVDAKTSHVVNISNLKPGQSYYFRIKTGDSLYDNGGIPFSFKTKGGVEATPTVALVPTQPIVAPTSAPVAATCEQGEDYNKDGAMNSLDIVYCKQNSTGTSAGGPTSAAPTTTTKATACVPGTDYNKDGAINVLDIVYCNQNK